MNVHLKLLSPLNQLYDTPSRDSRRVLVSDSYPKNLVRVVACCARIALESYSNRNWNTAFKHSTQNATKHAISRFKNFLGPPPRIPVGREPLPPQAAPHPLDPCTNPQPQVVTDLCVRSVLDIINCNLIASGPLCRISERRWFL